MAKIGLITVLAGIVGCFLHRFIIHWPHAGAELEIYDLEMDGNRRISLHLLWIEVLTVILWLLIYMRWGWSGETFNGCVFSAVLIVCSFIDLEQGIIPDKITYPALLTALLLSFWTIGLAKSVLGGLVLGGALGLIAVLSRGGMGYGDVKLAAVIGTFVEVQGVGVAFIIAACLGGVWGLGLMLQGQATRKTAVRFGPFLASGGWLAYNYSSNLLQFYLQTIFVN